MRQTGLKTAHDDLEREVLPRKKANQDFRHDPEVLEAGVAQRTARLRAVNKRLLQNEKQIKRLLDHSEQSRRALLRTVQAQKQADEALRKSAEEIQDLYNHAPCGYHSLDKDGIFVRINDTELSWLGYTREELVNKRKFSDILSPRSLDLFYETFPEFQRRGWVKDLDFEFVCKDGTVRPVLISATAIKDVDGNFVMTRSVVIDATERKRAEQEIRALNASLEERVQQRTQELAESESRFRTIYEASPVSIWREDWTQVIRSIKELRDHGVSDFPTYFQNHPEFIARARKEVKIVDANECTLGMFGASNKTQLLGSLENTFNTAGSLPKFIEELIALTEGQTVYRTEMVFKTLKGERIHGLLGVSFPPADSGSGDVLVTAIDITERKNFEEVLRRGEERMRLFFERQLVGMAITSPQKSWLQVNDKLCQMLGYSREELTRLTWAQMTYPDDLGADLNQFKRLLDGEIDGYTLEKRFVRKDGSIVFTNLAVGCVRKPDRSVDYVLALLEDITEHKIAEERLQTLNATLEERVQKRTAQLYEAINSLNAEIAERRQAQETLWKSSQMLKLILESMPAFVFWKDRNSVYISCNRLFATNAGLSSPEEITGLTDLDLPWKNDEAEGYRADDREVMETGVAKIGYEETQHTADGRTTWVRTSKIPLRNPEGDVIGVLGTFEDITARREAEQRLRHLNRELRAISNCNQALLRADNEESLLRDICRIVCAEAGYRMAWVGYVEHNEAKSIRPVVWAGVEDGYITEAMLTWADTERGRGPAGITIRTGRSAYIQDFAADTNAKVWRDAALRRGYRSNISLALNDERGGTFGFLAIYSSEPNAFTPEELRLLEELAGDLAFGIAVLRSRVERKRVEDALRQSEELFRSLVLYSPVGIKVFDLEGRVIVFNLAARELFGVTPDDPLTNYRFFNDPAVADSTKQKLRDGLVVQEERYIDFRAIKEHRIFVSHKTEQDKVFARLTFAPYGLAPGKPSGYIAIIQDLTDRKQAEEELRESEAKYRALIQRLQTAIVVHGIDGQIVTSNPVAQRLLGLTEDELLERTCLHPQWQFFREDGTVMPVDEYPVNQVMTRRQPLRNIIMGVRRHRDGHHVWAMVNADPVFDHQNRIVETIVTFFDITQRKHAEERLRIEAERSQVLLELYENAPEFTDKELYDFAINHAVQLTGSEMGFLHLVTDDQKIVSLTAWSAHTLRTCAVVTETHHAIESAGNWADCVRFRKPVVYNDYAGSSPSVGFPEGHPPIRRFMSVPVTEGDKVRMILGVANKPHEYDERDVIHMQLVANELQKILQQRRADEALKQAKEAAEIANHAKDQFLAVLSHELRTPLTPVLATISAMQVESAAAHVAELRNDISLIRRNVEMEAKLIDDLLDVTKISRGKLELHPEVVDAHVLLQTALEICQKEMEAKNIQVLIDLRAEAHHVQADPTRMRQVFWNLLKNATEFTPAHGQIRLRTSNNNGNLKIEVEDTGIGIRPEWLPKIFNAFERGDHDAAPRRFGGLGLGLSIAQAVVKMHQGTITAHSEGYGQGAKFIVELPCTAPVSVPAPPGPALQPETEKHSARILLVDDHPDTLLAMSKLLRKAGYAVVTADSVKTALDRARKESFDLLISDLGLPDGSGLDIMRQLRTHYPVRGIALSGYGTEEDVRNSRAAGFNEHLTKPVSFEDLRAAISRVASIAA